MSGGGIQPAGEVFGWLEITRQYYERDRGDERRHPCAEPHLPVWPPLAVPVRAVCARIARQRLVQEVKLTRQEQP